MGHWRAVTFTVPLGQRHERSNAVGDMKYVDTDQCPG